MKKIIIGLLSAGLIMSGFAGCSGKKDTSTPTGSATPQATKAADNAAVTIVGSTALQPMVEKASKEYLTKNPSDKITVQGGGSGTGLTQVSQGACTIGNSDIYAAEKLTADDAKALVDHKVCVVGFATVVNAKVQVDSLTKQQLKDVFTGKVTNWKEIGGNDLPIVIINRPSSSGTRATFKKYALEGQEEAKGTGLTEDSSGTVKKTVAETDGAVSYLALSYLLSNTDNTIKSIKVDGVEANAENIKTGKYPIWSYEHMYTKGEATGTAKQFIEYILSDAVQKSIIPDMGYISVAEMKVTRDN